MQNRTFHRVVTALLIAALLTTSLSAAALAATSQAGSQQTVASSVSGFLPGGEFAKTWLGFTADQPNSDVTINIEWSVDNPGSNGLHFYVLDQNGTATVVAGGSLLENNVASGSPVFQGPTNMEYATFRAGTDQYTVVVANDSQNDASFTISSTGGKFHDDSGQVTDPNATPTEEGAAESTDEATAEAPAEATAEATAEAPAETTAETTTEAAPEATAEADVTSVVTTTETTTETMTTTVTEVVATPVPAVATGAPVEVRATEMEGALPEQDDQHFLGLVPDTRDGEVTLLLTFDPQDSSELARRLNFWVLDANGLQRYIEGTNASEVAIAAGNRTFTGDTNERVATFTAAGTGPYTVIVYNNSQVPATYRLVATGGTLVDDSGQTLTAQEAGATAPAATAGTTTTVTSTTTTPATTTTTTSTAAAGTGAAGEPGGTYTVQAGDTLGTIAASVYGSSAFYVQICSFNNLADCNRIEVGQVLNLPTLEEANSGATAPAAAATATPAPAAAVTPVATAAATLEATEETTGTTGTGTAAATATPAATAAATAVALPTATSAASTGTTASGDSIIDELEANGNFTILLSLLEAAGLTENLQGAGNYTLFAPTDSAFQAMGLADVNAVRRSPELVENLVLFHLADSAIETADVTSGEELTTLQGSPVQFTKSGQTVKVQDSNIIVPDLAASNGVVQVIDAVMLPPQ